MAAMDGTGRTAEYAYEVLASFPVSIHSMLFPWYRATRRKIAS
jgi:hypothetical protein